LRRREPEALAAFEREHAAEIDRHRFFQFCFFAQWDALRDYARVRGVRFFGDLPIYVAHDSADVWASQDLFRLDEKGEPTHVAGVPPDYFSADGQRWGNPLYRWDLMAERDFAWWTRRMQTVLRQVDAVRLDHFRAFAGYWEIPASEPTAKGGRWQPGPGAALFDALLRKLGTLPVVAEDLGDITPDVPALMQRFHFPGMAVLQFAFGSDASSSFLPHNYVRNLVAYTGTHDNDTLAGWWRAPDPTGELTRVRRNAAEYVGADGKDFHWQAIRMVAASVARTVVLPMQDVLGLDNSARMNVPGESDGNWAWRLEAMPDARSAASLRRLMTLYGRCTPEPLGG
jgi:4-alpha-glucanotransferase